MHTLLEQTGQDEILILGCQTLFDFVNNQVSCLIPNIVDFVSPPCQQILYLLYMMLILQKDGTYMFNLEVFITRLCQLAQEAGDDERANHLRAAGLQALSSMV